MIEALNGIQVQDAATNKEVIREFTQLHLREDVSRITLHVLKMGML